jgi:hypothetical protein
VKAQTQQQKVEEARALQWRKTPTYGSLNLTTEFTTTITKTIIATKTTINKTCAMKKNHNIIIKTTTNRSYVC